MIFLLFPTIKTPKNRLLYFVNLLNKNRSPILNQLEKIDASGLTGQIDGVVFFC